MARKLTIKQERFCQEYIVLKNATKAAIKAGYSKRTAHSIGFENLKKPEIKKRIDQITKKTTDKLGITRERVLAEMAKLAFSNVKDLTHEDGSLKSIHELSDDAAASISSIEVDSLFKIAEGGKGKPKLKTGTTNKIKLWSKDKSLHMLGEHLGILNGEGGDDGDEDEIPDNYL